jgi:hypothetical protein
MYYEMGVVMSLTHADIKATTTLLDDGVHLNDLGGDILLSTITGHLKHYQMDVDERHIRTRCKYVEE